MRAGLGNLTTFDMSVTVLAVNGPPRMTSIFHPDSPVYRNYTTFENSIKHSKICVRVCVHIHMTYIFHPDSPVYRNYTTFENSIKHSKICVCVYVCMYIYTHTYIHIWLVSSTRTALCTATTRLLKTASSTVRYVCVCVCMYVYIYTHTNTYDLYLPPG